MTWQGAVAVLYIASAAGEPMRAIGEATAVAGRGLAGDRYAEGAGVDSWFAGPLREAPMIEAEVLEALRRDHNLDLPPGAHRRNIVTRGVPLGHLIGREFRVGEAVFRGVEISEPCRHLVEVTGITGVLSPLIHRGGLDAAVILGGMMRVGDAIVPDERRASTNRRERLVIQRAP